MPETVAALITDSAGAPYHRGTITRRDPGPDEIVIDIAYAGICHSDIHTARAEWGPTIFPLTPGHEIAGIVRSVGAEVTNFAPGDRVGVGCFVDSCGQCDHCQAGEEQSCQVKTVWTFNDIGADGEPTAGGYSTSIVVRAGYALHIPDSIPLDVAAPLLCAGITLYSPLKRWKVGPGVKVAIVGMGGLGHMGVKIAHAMGAEVTVLSRTLAKKADGLALGADHYYATSDPQTFTQLAGNFDLIISTVSDDIDVDAYLELTRLGGVFCFVGLPAEPESVKVGSLCSGHRILTGSSIGGIGETQEMLDFCATHGLAATIEVISADEVTDTYDRVVAGKVHYRAVIDIATL